MSLSTLDYKFLFSYLKL